MKQNTGERSGKRQRSQDGDVHWEGLRFTCGRCQVCMETLYITPLLLKSWDNEHEDRVMGRQADGDELSQYERAGVGDCDFLKN